MKRKRKHAALSGPPLLEAVLEDFRSFLSPGDFSRLLMELERPLHPSLRLNLLKTEPGDAAIQALSKKYGWQVEGVPFCPTGWWVRQARNAVSRTIEHRLGQYYIQDAASMLPPELFNWVDCPFPLILDMAASPGGKTTHLIDRSSDRGLVIANDSSKSRITALRLVLQSWGAVGVAVTSFPGEHFGEWYPGTFDRVLLDAPCSMQGLRTTENHPMRPITSRERDSLAARQVRLLESALRAASIGGQVVYSTCTLTPEENEGVLESVLQRHRDAFKIIDLSERLPRPAPALQSANGQTFSPQVSGAVRLWPHIFGTAGFFAALLVKTAPFDTHNFTPPVRSLSDAGLIKLPSSEQTSLAGRLLDGYGFDLLTLLERFHWVLYRRGDALFTLPHRLLLQFSGLPFVTAGLSIGEFTPAGFALSHEWAARFEKNCPAGRLCIPQERVPAWLRGEDLHGQTAPQNLPGKIALVEDEAGTYLGRGRVLADRLKNLLPSRLIL
ncbi:MAG: hypothetical protein IT308_03965 [Anaerolineaceae bacterium]|nr:hypothetical protein [Anaerolineaceae bacterium]